MPKVNPKEYATLFLARAIIEGNVKAAQAALAASADPSALWIDGRTTLAKLAKQRGRASLAALLDPTPVRPLGSTRPPLSDEDKVILDHVSMGDVDEIAALLDGGLSVNHGFGLPGGSNLLSNAVTEDRDRMIKLRLKRGADPRLGNPPVVDRKLMPHRRAMVKAAMRRINAAEARAKGRAGPEASVRGGDSAEQRDIKSSAKADAGSS